MPASESLCIVVSILSPLPPSSSSSPSLNTEKTKTSGYFYPTSPSEFPSSHTSSLSYRTSHPCPNDLVKSEIIPRELVMVIDSLQSGKVYSAVLQFNQPVYLTDMSISTNAAVGLCECGGVERGREGRGERCGWLSPQRYRRGTSCWGTSVTSSLPVHQSE